MSIAELDQQTRATIKQRYITGQITLEQARTGLKAIIKKSKKGAKPMSETKQKTQEQKYNGWTNYETWNVQLWLENGEAESDEIRRLAKENKDPYELSKKIRDYIEEASPLDEASLYADLLNSAFSNVNWYEIAKHWLDN